MIPEGITPRLYLVGQILAGTLQHLDCATHLDRDAIKELVDSCATIADAQLERLAITKPEPAPNDGWIPWNGIGKAPIVRGEVKCRDGRIYSGVVSCFEWRHCGGLGDIIAYRKLKSVALAGDWIPWEGGDKAPIQYGEIMYRNCDTASGCVEWHSWKHVGTDSDIIAYRPLKEETAP